MRGTTPEHTAVEPGSLVVQELSHQWYGGCERFAQVAQAWFSVTSIAWKPSTRQTVRSILDAHLLPRLGERPWMALDRGALLAFRAQLIRSNPGRHGADRLSAARANRVMSVLRQILTEAACQHGVANPAAGVQALRERRTSVRPFTWVQVQQLMAAAPDAYKDYVLFRCLTGLRSGEVNGLTWGQVDFDGANIRIDQANVRGQQVLPKNEYSERDLLLTDPLRTLLARQRARTGKGMGHVFLTPRGRPVDTSNFANRTWRHLLAVAGLPYRRPYEMRHTAAVLMLAAGEHPTWIARVLGHADCQMLWKVYARFVPNLTRQDGSALEAMVQQLAA